ncbi:hypothetical protein C6Y14_08930 [Streptomyces dioscori]|uniref:Uncharacterized protein n=1 Tax=Streptomyces dioscori TaxID=2109333 RepID=A0A2P8QBV9_9ACTN|nr:hypothetical protein [Streptomyces dioscori]PSM43737.1 hypothetical protein C6Y14_08930 [Streptomyces dioscori]
MTEKLLGPLSKRPWTERWPTRLLGAALSSAAYLLCLPRDLRDHPASPGSPTEATPVTVVGVTALAVLLLLLAVYFGHRDALAWPLLLVAVPPAALMYLSFHTHPETPGTPGTPEPAEVPGWPWQLIWASSTLVIAAGVLVATSVGRRLRADAEESLDGLVFARQRV